MAHVQTGEPLPLTFVLQFHRCDCRNGKHFMCMSTQYNQACGHIDPTGTRYFRKCNWVAFMIVNISELEKQN